MKVIIKHPANKLVMQKKLLQALIYSIIYSIFQQSTTLIHNRSINQDRGNEDITSNNTLNIKHAAFIRSITLQLIMQNGLLL